MTLILSPLAEAQVRTLAAQSGQTPETVLETLVQREMPVVSGEVNGREASARSPMLALFDAWDQEDRTDDPEELSRLSQEWEETKANLVANRLTLRDVSPLVEGEATRRGDRVRVVTPLAVVLDTTPLGLLTHKKGIAEAEACRA